jgi:hypothetical protein
MHTLKSAYTQKAYSRALLLELAPKACPSLELELESGSFVALSPEQAKKTKIKAKKPAKKERLNAAKEILWVIVLPRNAVAKHLMMLCTQLGFPALAYAITVAGLSLNCTRLP